MVEYELAEGCYKYSDRTTDEQVINLMNKYNDHDAFRLFLLESVVNDKVWILEHSDPLNDWVRQLAAQVGLPSNMVAYVALYDEDDGSISKGNLCVDSKTGIVEENPVTGIEEDVYVPEIFVRGMFWHRLFVESLEKLSKVDGKQAARILDKVLALIEEIKKCKGEE